MTFKPQNNGNKSPNNLAIMGQLYIYIYSYIPLSVWTGTIMWMTDQGGCPILNYGLDSHIGEVDGQQHVHTVNVKVIWN